MKKGEILDPECLYSMGQDKRFFLSKWQDNLGCGSKAPASLKAPLRKVLYNS